MFLGKPNSRGRASIRSFGACWLLLFQTVPLATESLCSLGSAIGQPPKRAEGLGLRGPQVERLAPLVNIPNRGQMG